MCHKGICFDPLCDANYNCLYVCPQKKVIVPFKTCQQIIQEREEELQKLRQEVESLKVRH